MTFGQLEALTARAEEARRDEVFYSGIVAAAVYNVHRESGTSPISPRDFLPEERPDLSEEEIAEQFAATLEKLARIN